MEFAIPLAIFVVLMAAVHPLTKRRHEAQGAKGASLRARYMSIFVMAGLMMLAAALLDWPLRVAAVLTVAVAFVVVGVRLDRRSAR